MSFQLNFALRHKYRSLDTGITIDANLIHGERQFKTSAKIDTGAKSCVFQREIGESCASALSITTKNFI